MKAIVIPQRSAKSPAGKKNDHAASADKATASTPGRKPPMRVANTMAGGNVMNGTPNMESPIAQPIREADPTSKIAEP
jgi:hypothetical protein